MNFVIYDLTLLAIFAIIISIFLHSRRKNLKKEGLLLLYKTSWGVKIIKKFGEKHPKLLRFLGVISIGLGYVLMALMIWFFGRIVWIYLFNPEFVKMIKIPPIMPLIPYLPSVFKLDFLPPFYFIYWIVILAVIAIPHEFAHGVYAAYNKVKIKTTGFGFFPYFFPVFLAAFVELDEKQLAKKSKFGQLSTLSAGTFANVLTGLVFFFILWGFFSVAYTPSGVVFDTYSYSIINTSGIATINNISVSNLEYESLLDSMEDSDYINHISLDNGREYWTSKELFANPQNEILFKEQSQVVVFDNGPAIRAGLSGAIYEIDGVEVTTINDLIPELVNKNPGQEINIKTITAQGEEEYNIVLEEHPEISGAGWLGIGFLGESSGKGILDRIVSVSGFFRDPHTYYKPLFQASDFVYNLLWWIVLVCLSIALINMLPVGIFDGGRFFYLTILAITRSEKVAKKTFKFMTLLFLFLVFVIMASWFLSIFL